MLSQFLKILFQNLWYKIFAIGLAVVIWALVQGEEVLETNRRIKVNISVANGYATRGKPYQFINATFRGPRFIVGELLNHPIEGTTYIASGEIGLLEIPFNTGMLNNWDNRIKVFPRDPYIKVFVDEKITRELPVEPKVEGIPAEGYFIKNVSVNPERAKVTGIKTEVSELEKVTTETINMKGAEKNQSLNVNLIISGVDPIVIEPAQVKIRVELGEKPIEKTFEDVEVKLKDTSKFNVETLPKVKVKIQAPPNIMKVLEEKGVDARVDSSQSAAGLRKLPVSISLPAGAILISVRPKTVSLKLESIHPPAQKPVVNSTTPQTL